MPSYNFSLNFICLTIFRLCLPAHYFLFPLLLRLFLFSPPISHLISYPSGYLLLLRYVFSIHLLILMIIEGHQLPPANRSAAPQHQAVNPRSDARLHRNNNPPQASSPNSQLLQGKPLLCDTSAHASPPVGHGFAIWSFLPWLY